MKAPYQTAAPARDGLLVRLTRQSDVMLTVLVVCIVVMMVLPLPVFLLDTLLCINLIASVTLLLATIYVPNALSLSTFPSLLLFTTLFRLGLNIASTKQILLHGNAGEIIETFGQLVVGGNVVVGLVVFIIIAIVQFLVIAKGSERVAEVGARFTLDALPGKQMAIDAELRNGHITAVEAKARRRELEQESALHGGMDGAMKFVKGDAIAGLVISLVNIVAGITIGATMMDMTLAEAGTRFTLLTVGDGLVSQIPSLFVSIAAGILITRVSTDDATSNLGHEITRQLGAQPKVLLLASGLAVLFLLVPGFPKFQFAVVAASLFGLWWVITRGRERSESSDNRSVKALAKEGRSTPQRLLSTGDPGLAYPVQIRLSKTLEGLVDARGFDDELAAARLRLRQELGMPFPGMRMAYDEEPPDNGYIIDVFDVPVFRGSLSPAGDESRGLSPTQVLVREAETVMRAQAAQLFGFSDMQALLRNCESLFPEVVEEALKVAPLQRLTELCRRLLEEGVSLRNLRGILEAIANWAPKEKDSVVLTEYVRTELARQISFKNSHGTGQLTVILLDPQVEHLVRQSIQHTSVGSFVALPPERLQAMVDRLRALLDGYNDSRPVVIMVSMDIRRYVRKLIESWLPGLMVMSYQEIAPGVTLKTLGRVEPLA
jgi:type III secretion protein V